MRFGPKVSIPIMKSDVRTWVRIDPGIKEGTGMWCKEDACTADVLPAPCAEGGPAICSDWSGPVS